MTLINRSMTKKDFPFFQTLIKSSPEWETEECTSEELEHYLKRYEDIKGKWSVWYVDNIKMAITYCVENASSNLRPWVGTIIVEPAFRQKGWGKKIVHRLTTDFQKNNHQIVYAAVSIHQNIWISFLASCGFEQYKIEKEDGKTFLLFVKPLKKE
ncbi:GNAT family N-acetyltransferase [Bacillus sp. DJP31]|uniref:GNAT family N-acetyltransferase n=1 Tax=Bacillus sp. DJP31 TaxID=3409789 RepID=UPI003BB680A7